VTVPEEALALWHQAQALLRGEFLADDQGSEWIRHRWIKLRQQALRMARGRMVRHLAALFLQQGHMSLAEEVLEEHLMRFPTDQDVLYRLLTLLEQQGCFEEACLVYERTKRTLEALGKQAAQHVRTRYEHLRASLTSPHVEVSLLKRAPVRERSPHPAVSSTAFPQLSRALAEGSDQELPPNSRNVPSPHAIEGGSEAQWEVLRILLEPEQAGRAGLPLFSRRQFLELGITALIGHLAQLDGARVSVIEREALSRALSESIMDGWKHLCWLRAPCHAR
jgi:hypothetical protein